MKLHELFNVFDGYLAIRIAKLVTDDKDEEIYCGIVYDFPYGLMHHYGSRNVLLVGHDEMLLPKKNKYDQGIRVLISRDEEDE